MNDVSIQIQENQRHFRPGETLAGSVTWVAKVPPTAVEVRLFWFTFGAAPQQIGMVKKTVFARPAARDTRQFQFALPAAPWSFRGELTGLSWAIEAVVLPSQSAACANFIVSPDGRRRLLSRRGFVNEADAV